MALAATTDFNHSAIVWQDTRCHWAFSAELKS